ncbi:MAG: [FeFe] hydrogenase H-cluster maturation GTPase HydF [Spirochaetes bacterium]|nr:[FeFe] hydrogenase H-cluster maturation GTPase HydF [Spirochaetota bacterium]
MTTPLAEQMRIVLYGLRNSGKSSLMNNLFEKKVSIISDTPGTTTDPVTRSIELGALGPVAVSDTAGFDDIGSLGNQRIKQTDSKLDIADLVLLVTRGDQSPTKEEKSFLENQKAQNKSLIVALTFADQELDQKKVNWLQNTTYVKIDNLNKTGLNDLKKQLILSGKKIPTEITPVEGLVRENDLVLLVTPIDLAAPKGRLILPQVETIRDLLDKDCACLVTKERELHYFYDNLKEKPKVVITDSQAFSKVSADLPENQLLTSFSILFARKKGDLSFYIEGVKQLSKVPAGAKILVLESCSHHRQADDIGTVKIPRLFKQLVQSQSEFTFSRSLPEPEILQNYHMVINCGGCMVTRNLMMNRINQLQEQGVYGLNYGLFLAWVNGLLPRALEPFPLEYQQYIE